ncbi:MAG: AAA family ATPase [bacterium]|nr:AAA family ATPase [bacterium]
MVARIQLLRNVGQFDSVDTGAQIPLEKLALFYAENGRGKTTLATILRSLSTGEPDLISDRRRLGAAHHPHIVVRVGNTTHTFQNGAWSASWPHAAVFDDTFVAENVCSGLQIESGHRQNLHELILGAQGVNLNTTLQGHVARIEEHNRALTAKGNTIPALARGNFTVDFFCSLEPQPNIENLIQEAERNLSAARASEAVRTTEAFSVLNLPRLDVAALNALLQRNLPDLDAEAAAQVQRHLTRLGARGEAWAASGVPMIAGVSAGQDHESCPFCSQNLQDSTLIQHYRSYFSAAYAGLKRSVEDEITATLTNHGGDAPSAFERSVSVALQRHALWHTLVADVPQITFDTAALARSRNAARDAVLAALRAKQAAPLEEVTIPVAAIAAIDAYHTDCDRVSQVSTALVAANPQINIIKERVATADVATLAADVARLKAVEARYSATVAPLCQDYLEEKALKLATETQRDAARTALDQYRQTVFPAYETDINTYLQRFNAGFRIGSVTPVNARTGSSCTYNVLINNTPVAATANDGATFRNTLSAGDRNTLALAFFFASLEQDPSLAQKTVVIDDPMTSLDEHRSLATIQQMRRLIDRVNQVIVLSHSKPFLCGLWEGADRIARSAMMIARDGTGSTLTAWDVNRDCVTEHDHRHAIISEYIIRADQTTERQVAAALRPTLEAFVRVAYPQVFPPGSMLGRDFLPACRTRLETAGQLLNQQDLTELEELLHYANTFHHDTNPAWQTAIINDQELAQHCGRTLAFSRRA